MRLNESLINNTVWLCIGLVLGFILGQMAANLRAARDAVRHVELELLELKDDMVRQNKPKCLLTYSEGGLRDDKYPSHAEF